MQGVCAGRQIDGRAHRGHGTERRIAAPFTGQLQHQVAAHRVARQRHSLQSKSMRIVAHHGAHVAGKSRMIKRGRQRIRAAAVAHVHADHVAAGRPGAGRNALNVAGVRRTLEPVDQHQRQPLGAPRIRLPMAVAQHAATVGRVHLDRFRRAFQPEGRPGKKILHDGL